MRYVDGTVSVFGEAIPVSSRQWVPVNGELKPWSDRNPANLAMVEAIGESSARFTHEVTLTYKRQPLNETEFASDCRHFRNLLLRKSLRRGVYEKSRRNQHKGIPMIGFCEGRFGEDKHLHLAIEQPEGTSYEQFKTYILDSWGLLEYSGSEHNKVNPYRGSGWLHYITKTLSPNNSDCIVTDLITIESLQRHTQRFSLSE